MQQQLTTKYGTIVAKATIAVAAKIRRILVHLLLGSKVLLPRLANRIKLSPSVHN